MSFNVHLHVCFNADSPKGIRPLAVRHLAHVKEEDCREAVWFLQEITDDFSYHTGPGGGLCLWGAVSSHADPVKFVELLRPFFEELLHPGVEDGPSSHEHILVFYEREGSERAGAYEIYIRDVYPWDFIVRQHWDLPFCWNQM